jgi:hypothetical protein
MTRRYRFRAFSKIEVRGKRGIGYCKAMPSTVRPYWSAM